MKKFRSQRLLTKKNQEDAKSDENKANGTWRNELRRKNEDIDQMMEGCSEGLGMESEVCLGKGRVGLNGRGADEERADRVGSLQLRDPDLCKGC